MPKHTRHYLLTSANLTPLVRGGKQFNCRSVDVAPRYFVKYQTEHNYFLPIEGNKQKHFQALPSHML